MDSQTWWTGFLCGEVCMVLAFIVRRLIHWRKRDDEIERLKAEISELLEERYRNASHGL